MPRPPPLRSEPVAFLVSPARGFPRRRTTLQKIAAHPLITFSRNTRPFVELSELFDRSDLPKPRIHSSSSIATIVKMAVDGLGVAVIPASIVAAQIKAHQLVELDCDARLPDLQFSAGWLATPDIGIVSAVADMAAEIAIGSGATRRRIKTGARSKK